MTTAIIIGSVIAILLCVFVYPHLPPEIVILLSIVFLVIGISLSIWLYKGGYV